MEIEIKFDERFKELMLSGVKTCTTRREMEGKRGDTFTAFGQKFIIIDTANVYFGHIIDNWWGKEGFTSPKEFVEFTLKYYGEVDGEVDIGQKHWIHWFKRCDFYLDDLFKRKYQIHEELKTIDYEISVCKEKNNQNKRR